MRKRFRKRAAMLLLCAVLAACGRVDNAPLPAAGAGAPGPLLSDGPAANGAAPGGTVPVAGAPGARRAAAGVPGVAAAAMGAGGGQGSTGGDPAAAPKAPAGSVTAEPRQVPTGKGVTDDEIRIGYQVSTGVQQSFALVGASGDPPNEGRVVDAVIDWINDTGGIAGRTVVPVIHETDITSGTFASQAQAACATFTEDNEVLAVGSSPVGGNASLLACLAAKQTPLVEQNHWWFDEQAYHRNDGWLYQPAKLRPERGGVAWVDGLAAAGYFRDATVGLLRFDDPVFTRVANQVVKPRLAHHGIELAAEEQISTPQSVSDLAAMNPQLDNAILRFREAGVTHVMIMESAAQMSFFFTQQAEAQRFRPRYGLSTYNTPSTLANQAPASQLAGAVGVGWGPPNDLFFADHPGGNPAYDACIAVAKSAGATTEHTSQGYYIVPVCDTLLFLRSALMIAPSLDAAGLKAATDALGRQYRSPFSFATRLGPGRYDGVAAGRPFAYRDACTCFRYTGPAQRIR